MEGRRVLFYDSDPGAGPLAERAMAAAGCEAVVCAHGDDLARQDLERFDIAVLTVDEGAAPRLEALLAEPARRPGHPWLVLHVGQPGHPCIEWMVSRPHLRHLIAKGEAPLDVAELTVTIAKLLRGDYFGLEKHLQWGAEPHRLTVRHSRDKAQYIREVSAMATRLGCSARHVERVETVVDELSTNALFDAPRDAAGQPRYSHLSRREPVALDEGEQGELTYAFDGRYFAVAQRDPFGVLTRDTVVTYLDRCLRQTPDQQPGAGGAGMGLFRVYGAVSKLIFNIRPGALTEVIGVIDLQQSLKQLKLQPKSLHFFIEEVEP